MFGSITRQIKVSGMKKSSIYIIYNRIVLSSIRAHPDRIPIPGLTLIKF